MIFQQFNLVARLSVLQNVLAGRLRFRRPLTDPLGYLMSMVRTFSRSEEELAFECLKKVGIEQIAFQRADTLSGGQQQRVAIARTLAQKPEVFLADEPIASLDPASAEVVMDTLVDIHETEGIPVIVNLHHIDLAEQYAKRIVGMKDGEVVAEGTANILTREMIKRIYGDQLDVDRLKLRSEYDATAHPPEHKEQEEHRDGQMAAVFD
jgi:phosphonate transport system ATP-binding protein